MEDSHLVSSIYKSVNKILTFSNLFTSYQMGLEQETPDCWVRILKAQTSLHIHAFWSVPLLFFILKVE